MTPFDLLDDTSRIQSADQLNDEGCLNLVETVLEGLRMEWMAACAKYKSFRSSENLAHLESIERQIIRHPFTCCAGISGEKIVDSLRLEAGIPAA